MWSPPPRLRRSLLCLLLAASAAPAARADEPPWINLFDGKTLKGWTQRGGAAKYEVKDGTILGTTVPNTKNTFLCTERSYGDFVLEYEFKVDPALNSGVQIRSQSTPDYQDGRVHGIQVEIDPDVKRGRMWTGGLYDEGRRGWLNDMTNNAPARAAFKDGGWNKIRVEAAGDSVKTWLNGVAAADIVDSMDVEGFIALQVHQVGKREEPLQIAWRNIRLQDLGRRAWMPLFDGKTARGFRTAGGGVWRVDGGLLVGTSGKGEKRHGLLFAEKPPGDSTLRLEYRLTGGNSGLYLHAQPAETPAGATGLQVDLDGQHGVGGLYETGGRGWVERPIDEKAAKAWKRGDWNRLTVSSHGGHLVVHVNDFKALTFEDDKAAQGTLALELNAGQDVKLEVRRLEVLSPPVPPAVEGFPIGWCIRVQGSAPDDARAAGFEYVELALQDVLGLSDEDFEKTLARLKAIGLPALTGYNFIPNELLLVGPQVDRARQDEHVKRGLGRLERLGLKYVVLGSGPARKVPEGFSSKEAQKQLVDFSRRFAREARKHKITVLLQPLRKTDTNLVNTVAEALPVVKAVGQPNFGLLVDYSFMVIEKEDPAILAKAKPYVRHVWISNPNGRVYPMSADEADYAAFFRALKQIGYRGGVSVHARTDSFFADAPRALAFLRGAAPLLAARDRRAPAAAKP
jgi:sugar phosphate isomerase/epimerase